MKRYESAEVICPFYSTQDRQKIYCEGVNDKSSIHICFGDSKQRRQYQSIFCCEDWQNCIIAKALDSKYKDGAGR